jgi:hypothetical protein
VTAAVMAAAAAAALELCPASRWRHSSLTSFWPTSWRTGRSVAALAVTCAHLLLVLSCSFKQAQP